MLSMSTIRIFRECTNGEMVNIGSMTSMITNEMPAINTKGLDLDVNADDLLGRALVWCREGGINMMTTRELMNFLSDEYGIAYSESLSMIPKSAHPTMSQYGISLSTMATMGKLGEIVNRTEETTECIRILSCMRNNSVILTGTNGCGRRTIVNGLAGLIASHNAPRVLSMKELYLISTKGLTNELTYRGQLDERIASIAMTSIREGYIIYLDSMNEGIEPMPGERRSILDALEEYVEEGHLSIIGVATPEEYLMITKGHQRMMDNFQRVKVKIPDDQCITEILTMNKGDMEKYHSVNIPDSMTREVIRLSRRYIPSGSRGGMLDILDCSGMIASSDGEHALAKPVEEWNSRILEGKYLEAAANIPQIHHDPNSTSVEVELDDVMEAIRRETGKDVFSNDLEVLGSLESELNHSIVNQKEQISEVCKLLRTAHVFRPTDKPLASILLVGVPGCGKTYLAQNIARLVFGGEILTINMENFREKFTVSRLLGSPPGYVGYDEGGIIPNWVREHPSSVILFDEVEKAHMDVYNILLGMMDQGQITDMQGTTHFLNGSLILMTSNMGSRHITDGYKHDLGFGGKVVDNGKAVSKDIGTAFSPAFLDRLSGQVQFNKLTIKDIQEILELELGRMCKGIDLDITITTGAKALVLKDWKENDGARGISRLITRNILEPISSLVIAGGNGKDVNHIYNIMGKINNEQRKNLAQIAELGISYINEANYKERSARQLEIVEGMVLEHNIREKLLAINALKGELQALGLRSRAVEDDLTHGSFLNGSELMREYQGKCELIDDQGVSRSMSDEILSEIWAADNVEDARTAARRVTQLLEEIE